MDKREIGMEEIQIIPPRPGTCPECAVDHDRTMPHNRDSLYYQMRFRQRNGRFPTWADAMAHCSDMVKAYWTGELAKRGIRVTDEHDGRSVD